ncbi:pRL2-8 [Streptomyces venezuelae]|uniref:pRL2-8 n=1 Tax=Streptomyces venezuelae TaxID=54571 RepID=UPI0036468741
MPTKPLPTKRKQCPQCWEHAHNKAIHKALKGKQCEPCLDHMVTNCRGFYAQ